MRDIHFFFTIALIVITTRVSNAQIAQLPFKEIGQHMYIKVLTNNSDTLDFIFDTGCTGATIDSLAAKRLGINDNNRKNVVVSGSGGAKALTAVSNQQLRFNNLKLNNVNLVLADFSSLTAVLRTKLDGIIGYELLNQYVTAIDFVHKKILFHRDMKSVDTAGYTSIPFEFNKNVQIPRFPITITLENGESFTGRVMFDTGNAFPLLISAPYNNYHHIDSKLGKSTIVSGRGINAVTRDRVANIKSLEFNGFKFGPMGIRLTVNNNAEPKDGYLGILGLEVIKHFNVILDYSRKKIYLKPNQMYDNRFDLTAFQIDKDSVSRKFFEKNRRKAGVHTTASGLQYEIIHQGTGNRPSLKDRVSLHYIATLLDGTKLWNTYENNIPWNHHLDKTIEGVREAVLLMPEGSRWKLYIPPSLGFGDRDYEDVPAGASLIYDLEVLQSEK